MAALAFSLLGAAPQIITGIAGLVHSVESIFGKGNGSAKKAAVVSVLPTLVSTYDSVAGTTSLPQINQQEFTDAYSELIDSIVKFYNVAGIFHHQAPAPAPAPITQAPTKTVLP